MAARVIVCINCTHYNYHHYADGNCSVCNCKTLKIHPQHKRCSSCGGYADDHSPNCWVRKEFLDDC